MVLVVVVIIVVMIAVAVAVLALISASGAAGDCDGDCMENANSILAMTIIMFGSVCGLILGYICISLGHKPD